MLASWFPLYQFDTNWVNHCKCSIVFVHGYVASSQPAVPAAFTQPIQCDGVADAVLVPIHNQGATGKQVPVHRLQSTNGTAGWFSLQVILHQACHMLGNSQ